MANPELIESYVSGSASGGSDKNTKTKSAKTLGENSKNFGEIKPGDGNLGVDFSHLIDETPSKVEKTNIKTNGEAPDYYSAVSNSNN